MTATASTTAIRTSWPTASLSTGEGPYKGLRAYETEDAHLFRGRTDATERLLSKVLSSRTTILHAPSAAGKTSLINARLITGLEARGWMAVRARAGDDPMATLRFDTVRQLLAPPRAEAVAIRSAHDSLAKGGETLVVGELLTRYDALPIRDERRRALGAPVKISDETGGLNNGGEVATHPMFCRLLRGSIDVLRFDEHLETICGEALRSAADVPALALAKELENKSSANAWTEIIRHLTEANESLCMFFDAWWHHVACNQKQYGIVLCLDQFEELFTRYADPGPGHRGRRVLDWRIRDQFFGELDALSRLARQGGRPSEEFGGMTVPPLRMVISLRDEYIAQLDRVRPAAERAEDAMFHLPRLTLPEATEAIKEPAAEFGFHFEDACFNDIMQKLAQEQRFMEPAHLQIVCDRLWRACTQPPAREAPPEVHALVRNRPPQTIDYATYEFLGKAEGILRRFFLDFLAEFPVADQLEILEMLELLITPGGTRNIADWTQLTRRRFRDAKRRNELLEKLQNATIVRAEWRHGTQFVELTHEFLIEPVRRAIKEQLYGSSENARLLAARRALEHASGNEFRTDERVLLSPNEIDALLAGSAAADFTGSMAMRHRGVAVAWDVSSAEVLLRSAVVASYESSDSAATRMRDIAALYALNAEAWRQAAGLLDRREPHRDTPSVEFAAVTEPPMEIEAVVSSYLKSSNPKVPFHAIHALGWLADEASIRQLVDLALEGKGEIGAAAERELSELPTDAQAKAVATLSAAVADPVTSSRAYVLLGRLSAQGAEVKLPPMSWRQRRRLASTPVAEKRAPWYKPWRWRRRWRALKIAMLGCTAGIAMTAPFLALVFRDDPMGALSTGFLPVFAFGLLIATPMLVLTASRHSDPIHVQADRAAASFVEVERAAFTALFPMGLLYLWAASTGDQFPAKVALIFVLVVATACTRAGTIAAFEAFVGRFEHTKLIQMLFGGICGSAITGLGAIAIARGLDRPTAADGPVAAELYRAHVALFAKAWVAFIPAWFGLALAYADPEAESKARPIWSEARVRNTRRALYAFAIVGLIFVPILVAIRAPATGTRRFRHAIARVDDLDKLPRPGKDTLWLSATPRPVLSIPAHYRFIVPKPDTAAETTDSLSVIEVVLSGRDASILEPIVRDSSLSTTIPLSEQRAAVKSGVYYLAIGSHVDLGTNDYASELITRLSRSVLFEPWDAVRSRRAPEVTLTLRTREVNTTAQAARDLADSAIAIALDSDSVAREAKLPAAQDMVDQAIRVLLVITGRRPAPVSNGKSTGQRAAPTLTWETLNEVCWAGAIVGKQDEVLSYCNRAIELQRNSFDVDSRGLALALVGDTRGAIGDFVWYIRESKRLAAESPANDPSSDAQRALRQQWIDELKATNRPLDAKRVRADLARTPQ